MENISVCIRIRPKVKEEDTPWHIESNTIYNSKSKETFAFDKIIDKNSTNSDMFANIIKDNLKNFINGINMSVFAYGQTSTGKTFTMRGNDKSPGIIPLAIKEIFRLLEEDKSITKYTLKASYLELYNETVNDLLNTNNKNLEIRESSQKGVFVNNLTEIQVTNPEKAMQLLKQGDSIRVIAETKLNEKSSRSHSIFRLGLEINKIYEDNQNNKKSKTFFSQMNLIDLAGSENVSKAKTDGIRMKEGSNINKSLLALSNVISKLSANPKTFVNFRDSKLTRLLQNGLSGNSKTSIICTISEALGCYSETLNTLHFGNKAKNIKTDIKINELLDEKHKILSENNELKNKIRLLEDMMKEKKEFQEKEKINNKEKIEKCNTKDNEKNTNTETNKPINTEAAGSFEKIFSDGNSCRENLEEEKNKEKMISALEKEINILKRMLISNEEIGEDLNDFNNQINFQDNFSFCSFSNNALQSNQNQMAPIPNNISNFNSNAHLHMSAQKFQKINRLTSATKFPESANKNYSNRDNHNNSTYTGFFEPENPIHYYNIPNQTSNSIYRRNMTMTDFKQKEATCNLGPNFSNNSAIKNFALNNSSNKIGINNQMTPYVPNGINNLLGSAYKNMAIPHAYNSLSSSKQINQFNAENDIDMILNVNNSNNNLIENNFSTNCFKNSNLNGNFDEFGYNCNSAFGFTNITNVGELNIMNILKTENEELKKNYIELKNKFMETVQIKDNQIKKVTANMNLAMDNCEKLIREAEENYINLKLSNERLVKDLDIKEVEIKNLNINFRNSEVAISNYKDEINKLNADILEIKNKNGLNQIENELIKIKKNYNEIKEENITLKENITFKGNEYEKLKQENNHLKISFENFKSENLSYKTQVDCLKKTTDSFSNENGKLKNDIESYKNEIISNKEKINKMKNEVNSLKGNLDKLQSELNNTKNSNLELKESNLKKSGSGINSSCLKNSNLHESKNNKNANNPINLENLEKLRIKIVELEIEIKSKNNHINLLEKENISLRLNTFTNEKANGNEYRKVIEESLLKIKNYEDKLNLANEKIFTYEKLLKISESKEESKNETPLKQLIPYNEKILSNSNIANFSKSKVKNIPTRTNNTNQKSKICKEKTIESKLKELEQHMNNGVSQFICNEADKDFNKSIFIQTPNQNETKIIYNSNNKNNIFISPNKFQMSDSKEFLGKKRHLSKVYQSMIDKNLKSIAGDGNNISFENEKRRSTGYKVKSKEEKENLKEACPSSFEI